MKRSCGWMTAAALLATGCAPSAGTATAAGPGASTTPIMAGLKWTTTVGGAGVGLTLAEADGTTLLQLACTRSPATLTLTVPGFRRIGSEERLTLGLGGEAYAFVADSVGDSRPGVEARGPIPVELLNRLAEANDVTVAYGVQRIGPHIPADRDSALTFATACRRVPAS